MEGRELLIVGAGGQLGKALVERFPEARAVGHDALDITDAKSVAKFDWAGVKVILNAAAYTKVDMAETAEGRAAAWATNVEGTARLAKAALDHDLTLVQISTDYVFDGAQKVHTEDEPLTPLGVYGQTKAAADVVAGLVPKHYLLRTSWVVGDGPNFVRTMISLADRNISPKVVDDQIGRLTFASTLARTIGALLEQGAAFGTYNVSDSGEPASWAEVTRTIFKELGRDDLTVTDVSTAEYFKDKPQAAPRPLESTLDLAKIEATGVKLPDWRTGLHDYIKQEQAKEARS
ncbi:MAG TPA: NAD(P)-dependent oxidoreductase [Candidatus Saccharimonadia bacterium]|nr:NAD(P)-dependent oxidoreductase [Candidatus Saccharimonadia bacterium]